MARSFCILLAVLSLGLLSSAHLHEDLADRYSNFKLLSSPSYELYWDVDEPSGNLSLAVRVNTTGWVGFGVSPNGGMPNSDVVMGWVEDDGTVVFQVVHFVIYRTSTSDIFSCFKYFRVLINVLIIVVMLFM